MVTGTLLAEPARAQIAPGQAPPPAPPGAARSERLERLLDALEDNAVVRLLASPDGFGLRMGGIAGGSGMAIGPSWQSRRLLGGRLEWRASGAIAPLGDRALDAGVTIPELLSYRIRLQLFTGSQHLARESFYGIGPRTAPDHRSAFAIDRRSTGIAATIAATRRLELTALAGVTTTTATDGAGGGAPGISARWPTTPALHMPVTFTVMSAGASADFRDVPGNPRRGGRYALRLHRFADRSAGRHSFNRVEVDLEHHVSWWRGQRLLTLRALAIATDPDSGHAVPFHLQPALGGSAWLRGFGNGRFRDNRVLALQAEYGWDIWPFLNAVLFYETGQVAPTWADLFTARFKRDYGFGFRFGSARTVAVRTDIAFGSGEGTRFSTRFSHAF
jgi:outer membrane protein assembly factor BamA